MTVHIDNHKLRSNVYDQRAILKANITRIVKFQNSREYIKITGKNRLELCKLLDKQRKYQRELTLMINEREQLTFNFGG